MKIQRLPHRSCLASLVITLFCLPVLAHHAAVESKPNILFIIVDDQSPFDLKIYNAKSVLQTPNIDRLAAEGGWSSTGRITWVPSAARYVPRRGIW